MMLRRRPDSETKEPIALRTRSGSSRSTRFRQEQLLSDSDSDLGEESDNMGLDTESDNDISGSDSDVGREVRRSTRTFAPPARFVFEFESSDAGSEDTASQEVRRYRGRRHPEDEAARDERRDKSRILKLMRRVEPDEAGDEIDDFLQKCDVGQCRAYYERHQTLSGGGAKPLRIQLYDLMPSLTTTNAACIFERVQQIEDSDPFSSEGAKLSGWAKTVMSIPFGHHCPLPTDDGALSRVSAALDQALYGQRAAKDALLQAAAQMMSSPTGTPTVLVLVGAPGVGKTTLARALGTAMGLPFQQISLGGCRDAQQLRGHGFCYEGSECGTIIKALRRSQAMNPVILLDEADKVSDGNNEVSNFMIHLLDNSQRHEFVDDYVDMPVDLSKVLFVLAVNDLEAMHPVLRNRLQEVPFESPDTEAKIEIALRHLVPDALRNCGLTDDDIVFTRGDLAHIAQRARSEPGVRDLARAISSAVMRVNVLMRGGGGLDLAYKAVDVSERPVRIDPATFDALSSGDRAEAVPNPYMYC
jgi:hypothetical protein